ncbi:MAG: GMC family oxidoreductase [Bryobacteraceae bacterium]
MAILAKDWSARKPRYDVIVVGSGYGGSINAARIAASGLATVCVLERGREWPVGTFPDTDAGYVANARISRFDGSEIRLDNPLGVYETVIHKDISVIKGNGLGGTSLVNANVAIRPDPEVFTLPGWPAAITRAELDNYYPLAEATLGVAQTPGGAALPKVQALDRRAQQIGQNAELLNLAINFNDRINPNTGEFQKGCIKCGDCYTGCNVGAKNTLYMNYLPLANNAGADIFTQIEIEWVEKVVGGWKVHGKRWIDRNNTEPVELESTNLILSAGAVNTPEILIRSRDDHGLSLSPAIGTKFGANGDFFGIAYNGDHQTRVLGFGNHPGSPLAVDPTGPAIVAAVRYNAGAPIGNRFTIEDLSFASAFVARAQRAFAGLTLISQDTDHGLADDLAEAWRVAQGLVTPLGTGTALNYTMFYLCMGIDDSGGRVQRDSSGKFEISWPNAGLQPVFATINAEIFQHAKREGAHFAENPLWVFAARKNVITAHPLGGCTMSDDPTVGATDQYGRVYDGGGGVHDGLLVADGSLLPSALAVNPFLTISAISERIAKYKVDELNGIPYP